MPTENDNLPLVTVVTTTFNLLKAERENLFHECFNSVHSQTYPHIEHLVIDGASTDGTKEMLEGLAAKGMITLVSEPDKGIYDAMNKAVRLAKGKYIAFLNSDDFWHDNRGVEYSVRELEREQADFSYACRRIVDEEGKVIMECEPTWLGHFFCRLPFCHQTMFTRTEVLREIGGFDQEYYRMAADYDVMTRLILEGRKEVEVPLNFTSFRMGGFSTLNGAHELHEKECKALFRRHFGPIIGDEAAEELYHFRYKTEFVDHLLGRLRPTVATSFFRRSFQQTEQELGKLRKYRYPFTVWMGPFQLPLLSRRERRPERTAYRLFSLLPLMTVRHQYRAAEEYACHRYKLFGFLPIWKHVHNGHRSDKHYLFGFLPIFGRRNRV